MRIAVFANGCFWCTEAVFAMLRGVGSVKPGYSNGAECIKIEYDPAVISYNDLLTVFFNTHDPTTLNRQGNDIGTEYRSAIFYIDDEQKDLAEKTLKELDSAKAYDRAVVTEVTKLSEFKEAKDYHHEYYKNHEGQPYCELVIAPKLEKMQKRFSELLK